MSKGWWGSRGSGDLGGGRALKGGGGLGVVESRDG